MSSLFGIDPTSLAREEPVRFDGPTGSLEGLYRPAKPGTPQQGITVVAHPHPQFGGTMLNKVVFHTARMLNANLNLATLRFNFRGIGASRGTYDEGRGEKEDVLAAWDYAEGLAPGLPLVGAGFSFGAGMTIHAAAETPKAVALALVGIPMRLFPLPRPFPRSIPLAAVHGAQDEFTPPEKVEHYLQTTWPGPHDFKVIPEADHFLTGVIPEGTKFLVDAVREYLAESRPAARN